MTFKFIRYFMDVAKLTANLSHAKRLKVGSIIVKDNRIISIGYNGTPAGWDNNCEHEVNGKLTTKDEVIHAEENAILKLARDGESGKGTTMYVTHAPCINCARLIYNAGVSSIYYEIPYRDTTGIDFLQKCGISVQKIGSSTVETKENVEKTPENPVTEKYTRQRFGKLLKSGRLLMVNREYIPVNIDLIQVVDPVNYINGPGEAGIIVVGISSPTSEKYNLYKTAIHETQEEVFEELADVLYNMRERGEIFVQERW